MVRYRSNKTYAFTFCLFFLVPFNIRSWEGCNHQGKATPNQPTFLPHRVLSSRSSFRSTRRLDNLMCMQIAGAPSCSCEDRAVLKGLGSINICETCTSQIYSIDKRYDSIMGQIMGHVLAARAGRQHGTMAPWVSTDTMDTCFVQLDFAAAWPTHKTG